MFLAPRMAPVPEHCLMTTGHTALSRNITVPLKSGGFGATFLEIWKEVLQNKEKE